MTEDEFAATWTITVTEDDFAFYREQCEQGLTDFCRVGIPGFTPLGMTNLLDYLNALLGHIRELNNALDYWERVGARIDTYFKEGKNAEP